MTPQEIVARSPFKYHSAASMIEDDVAAVLQAAARNEGHTPAAPHQNVKTGIHEEMRERAAEIIMQMIEESGHVSYQEIRQRIVGASMYTIKIALADLKVGRKISYIQTRANMSNVYCLQKDALKVVKLYPAAKIVRELK